MKAFTPGPTTANIVLGAGSNNVQVSNVHVDQVYIFNKSSDVAFIQFGTDSSVAASTATSMPIPAGAALTLTVPLVGPCWVAAIASGPVGTFYITPGHGL